MTVSTADVSRLIWPLDVVRGMHQGALLGFFLFVCLFCCREVKNIQRSTIMFHVCLMWDETNCVIHTSHGVASRNEGRLIDWGQRSCHVIIVRNVTNVETESGFARILYNALVLAGKEQLTESYFNCPWNLFSGNDEFYVVILCALLAYVRLNNV